MPRDDRHLLSDPMAGLSDFARPLIEQWYGSTTLREPEEVVDVEPFSHHQFANLDLEFLHAPGHAPGCSMIRTIDAEFGPIVMSGDVVFFAGSIGRTDMPGGDPARCHTASPTSCGPWMIPPMCSPDTADQRRWPMNV